MKQIQADWAWNIREEWIKLSYRMMEIPVIHKNLFSNCRHRKTQ
jgi:hypothetical protein